MWLEGEYDAATVALRVLRVVTVASIFAFVLTVRTVAPIHATDDPASDPSPPIVDSTSTDVVEPAPSDPPPADTVDAEVPPSDPPIEVEPLPGDTIEPAPSDPPPADTVDAEVPPSDPPAAEVPLPQDTIEPAPSDPPPAESTTSIVPDPSPTVGGLVASDPSEGEPARVPSAHQSPVPAPPVAENPAQATAPVTSIVSILANRLDGGSDVPTHTMGLDSVVAAGAGLAAGLVITNHAPGSVAVALEFGRAGGGWAGALVFNLWLRRQLRERRMSQRQLAALSGVDHSTISRLLRQDRRPSLITATKLAGALKQLRGEQAEPEAAAYFERIPEETVFPARRVELALRADEMLDDEQVRRLMYIYLDARRKSQANALPGSSRSRAAPARAAPARAGRDAS
jgi:transcriptional regulator with XRE-family HTH domain